ncbi:hypothetical protein BaRGS_00015162, partial [Batillaria attramentaria]
DGMNYMQLASVLVDGKAVHTFCDNQSCIDNPHTLTLRPPLSGQIVKLTRPSRQYLTLCELQVEGCERDIYGVGCTQVCSPGCVDGRVTTTCDSITGHCLNGCQSGWWGAKCDEECSSQCDGPCDTNNGHCFSCKGCAPEFHGMKCETPCGYGCINKTCNRQDGACSCQSLWSPPNCAAETHAEIFDPECRDGYYGREACRPCGHCTNNTVCDNNNGHCPDGCVDGYSGDLCDEEAQVGDSGESSDGGAIAGGVVGVVVILAVAALVVVIVLRRRRSSKGSGTRGVDEAADLARADTLSSSQATNVSADQSPRAAKAKKPKAQIKPFSRAETKDEEQGGSVGHFYSNITASTDTATEETPSQRAAGENRPQNAASTSSAAGDGPAKSKTKPGTAPKPAAARGAGQVYENVPVPQGRGQTEKPPEPFPRQPAGGKNLDAFQRYLIACLGSGELGDQFENLPKGMRHPHTIGLSEENKRKNRFKALCTYDFNRVVLRRPKGDKSSDYINATYIKGYQRDQQYIATQGPRANTTDDLWWMVWQEGITQIVMLANLQEDGRDKCEEYWPASGKSQTYGHVTVKGLEEQQRADFVIRSFVLKNAKSSGERHVTQYHYMAWPDHGVPLAASLVDYWRYVKARSTSTVPLLVHCSAGVGRTGTFIALDIASEKKSRGDDVNVNEIVTQLREQRALMVQSEAQYKFLHEVILEAHTSRATRVSTGQFDDIFPDTIQTNTNNSRIDSEFQMLKHMGQYSAKPKHTMATMPENRDKNRNMNTLPDDDHVVYLSAHVRGRNQYINAVYLSSFHHRRGFVLTQLPIPDNTLIDFWRLVEGCHVTKIVSLGSDKEEKTIKNYCRYWPRGMGEVMTTGPYTITSDSGSKLGDCLSSYRLTLTKADELRREVEVFHYRNWAGEVPGDTSSLLQLVDTVKGDSVKDVTSPIIVQCIDGAAKSGLFCALFDVISRVTYDDEVDAYLTAREVQRIRPQAVATNTQYRYLYHVAQAYIRHVGVYANSGVK